jgi:hypothetical protein
MSTRVPVKTKPCLRTVPGRACSILRRVGSGDRGGRRSCRSSQIYRSSYYRIVIGLSVRTVCVLVATVVRSGTSDVVVGSQLAS